MNYLLGLLLVINLPFVNQAHSGDFVNPIQNIVGKSITYKEIHDEAIFNCPWAKISSEKQKIIWQLIKIEKSFNPPPKIRGMLLAAACMESGYDPNAKGDKKFSKSKKTPMAIGILQQWPFYEKAFPGMNRKDPKSAAMSWMKHIVKQIPNIKKTCGYKTDTRIWLAAWVTGIRYKKEGGRCKEFPKHYRLLKRWHKNIRKDRKIKVDCASQDSCGC